ncbi:MAG: hypothetical protein U1F10_01905 [Burkholderiales bacterium]
MKVRKTLLALALVTSLVGTAAGVEAATVNMPTTGSAVAGGGTSIDWAIDAAVAARNLPAADAAVLREQIQLQYQSLSASARAAVVAAAGDSREAEAALRVVSAVGKQVERAAREMEAAARQADLKFNAQLDTQGIQPKLGGDGDLVYLSTVGPCRIYDSRNGPGQLPAVTARQIYTISILNGYNFATDQGGTGITGSGNCVQTAFLGVLPTAAVAIVTVVNTSTSGALQAWNGGTTLSGGAVLNWNAGDRLTNTTIIPMNRSIPTYPGSGTKRDIGVYNNSGAPVDFVIDVVGYMIENQATALDCTTISGTLTSIPALGTLFMTAPACPAGYTTMTSQVTAGFYGLYTGTAWSGNCRVGNFTASALNASCDAWCCRIPGR